MAFELICILYLAVIGTNDISRLEKINKRNILGKAISILQLINLPAVDSNSPVSTNQNRIWNPGTGHAKIYLPSLAFQVKSNLPAEVKLKANPTSSLALPSAKAASNPFSLDESEERQFIF